MAAARIFVLLANCAFWSLVTAGDQCSSALWGIKSNNPVNLPDSSLNPPQTDTKLDIPSRQTCNGVDAAGVLTTVCDDVAPSVTAVDEFTSIIHRNVVPVVSKATAKVTVYCPQSYPSLPRLSIFTILQITEGSNDVSAFQLLARLSFPTVETKPYNMPSAKEIDPHFNYADEKFEKLQDYYNYMNSRMKEPHNPTERREILELGAKKLNSFIDSHLKDLKRLLFATDMALMSMVLLKLNKKMDTSEAKIKSTQAKIPFGLYTSPEFKCLDTSYYIVSAHNQEDAQMILSSERKPHCYTFRGAFAFTGFYHRHSETTYVGPHAEQFQAKDPSQGLYCHSDDNWSDAQCIYKINPREEFPESVEYEPKISYFCGPYRYFIPATTDVRCIFSIFSMNFVFRFGYDGVTYKSSDLSFMYQNGQVFYTDEPWVGMSCWNWACKWRHNQNQRSNEFFVN